MKIVLCSNVHGQPGTSSNMLAIALMSDVLYGRKSIMLQTQFTQNRLEVPLLKKEQRKRIEQLQLGMNALIKSMLAGMGTRELLKNCCLSLGENSIDFLPGPYHKQKQVYERELEITLHEMIKLAEQCYEYVYIDCGVEMNPYAMKVLEEADLILVSTCQNKRVLDDLFENYKLPDKPIFYLIGNYDKNSQNSIGNLFHSYKELNKHNTFVIPYNIEFKDAVSESFITSFFYRNICCEKEDENYNFIKEVQKAVRAINEYLDFLVEEREKIRQKGTKAGGSTSVS